MYIFYMINVNLMSDFYVNFINYVERGGGDMLEAVLVSERI